MVTFPKYSIRTYDITHKTRDISNLDRKIKHFLKHRNVVVTKGMSKNLQGRIVGNVRPLYSKNDFIARVKLKDLSKVARKVGGLDTFYYRGNDLKLAKPYRRVLPKWTSDIR